MYGCAAYIETSVWSMIATGQDPALREASLEFLQQVADRRIDAHVSPVVLREVGDAPPEVAVEVLEHIERCAPQVLDVGEAVETLADASLTLVCSLGEGETTRST